MMSNKHIMTTRILENNALKSKKMLIMIVLLSSITYLIYYTGGTSYVYMQFMYIPIFVSSYIYRQRGTIITSVCAGLLLGPLMPLRTYNYESQDLNNWIIRLLFFVALGLLSNHVFRLLKDELQRKKIILEQVHDGICEVNNYGQVTSINSKLHKLLGVKDSKKILGRNIVNLVYPDASLKKNEKLYTALEKGLILSNNTGVIINCEHNPISIEYSLYPVINDNERQGFVIALSDITERLSFQDKLYEQIYTDSLTNTKNRRYFDEELIKFEENLNLPVSLVLWDIDGLKFINDSFGHSQGDYLIKQTSLILLEESTDAVFVSRLDGNEFAVLFNTTNSNILDDYISKVQNRFSNFSLHNLTMSISCGYETRNEDNISVYDIFTKAENNMYLEKNSSIKTLRFNAVDTIMNTLHEKDEYSEEHSKSVSKIATKLSKHFNIKLNKISEITTASLLHDIGKIIIPIDILIKETKLSETEYNKIKEHPEIGFRLLSTMNNFQGIANIVLHHHERWDGNGYPGNISKESIPIGSRIVAIADTFNAMTTSRPYSKAKSKQEALAEINRCSGTQFDPNLVKVFNDNFEDIIN